MSVETTVLLENGNLPKNRARSLSRDIWNKYYSVGVYVVVGIVCNGDI